VDDDDDEIGGWRMLAVWLGIWATSWLVVVGIVWLGVQIVRAVSE
jgi:hypothetical protein